MTTEHITLQPHPLDQWRRALDALIAVAPDAPGDIAAHLFDAARQISSDGERPTYPTGLQRWDAETLVLAMQAPDHDTIRPLADVHHRPAPATHSSTPAHPDAPSPPAPALSPAPGDRVRNPLPGAAPTPNTRQPSGHHHAVGQ